MVTVGEIVGVKVGKMKGGRVCVTVGVAVIVGVLDGSPVAVEEGGILAVGVSEFVAVISGVLVRIDVGVAVGPGGRLMTRITPKPRQ